MSGFARGEVEYLRDQRLGRLAPVNAAGRPHVVPVGFRLNPELGVLAVGGRNLDRTKKFRDAGETGQVALVADDASRGARNAPWRGRGVEARGRAEVFGEGEAAGAGFGDELIRIFTERIAGWGIDPDAPGPITRSVPR